MKLMKRSITLVLTIFTLWNASAQDMLNLVPKEAAFVGMLNAGQIKSKMDFEQALKLPLFQKMNAEFNKELSRDFNLADSMDFVDLRKHGINIDSKSYFYFVMGEKMYYGASVFSITDKNKFQELVKVITGDPKGENIKSEQSYQQSGNRKLHVVWNDKTAAFFGASISEVYKDSIERMLKKEHDYDDGYNYNYYDEAIVEAVEEVSDTIEIEEYLEEEVTEEVVEEVVEENPKMSFDEFYDIKRNYTDSIEKEWLKQNTSKFIQSKGTNSYASNSKFKEYTNSQPDAVISFDYGMIYHQMMRPFSRYSASGMMGIYSYLFSFYQGTKLYAKIDFKKDNVELNVDMAYNKKFNDVFDNIKKKKISKKLVKYIDKDVWGYYALGLDIEGTMEGAKKMLRKTLPQMPEYGNIAVSGMDMLDIIIDEKALYNVFTGDAVIAFNGVKDFEVIYKTYDYDEDFKRFEITDTTMKKMPEVLFMAGVGNKSDVQKLIKLGLNAKVLKPDGNLYSLDIRKNKIPVHFRIYDDILFISNNKKYLQNPVKSKTEMLSKQHAKLFKKNTFVGFANTAEIARFFADVEKSSYKEQKMLIETSNLFKKVWMSGGKKGNAMHSKHVIELSDTEENSIFDIIKFFNQLYLISEKRS